MFIERDGKKYELAESELMNAYKEERQSLVIEDIKDYFSMYSIQLSDDAAKIFVRDMLDARNDVYQAYVEDVQENFDERLYYTQNRLDKPAFTDWLGNPVSDKAREEAKNAVSKAVRINKGLENSPVEDADLKKDYIEALNVLEDKFGLDESCISKDFFDSLRERDADKKSISECVDDYVSVHLNAYCSDYFELDKDADEKCLKGYAFVAFIDNGGDVSYDDLCFRWYEDGSFMILNPEDNPCSSLDSVESCIYWHLANEYDFDTEYKKASELEEVIDEAIETVSKTQPEQKGKEIDR